MWHPIENFRHRRARRRFLLQPPRRGSGTLAKVALLALAVILAVIAALEARGGGESAALAEYVRTHGLAPLDLIEQAAKGRRLVFLADIHGAAPPKRLAAEAVERLGTGIGLDVLALEVPASEQPFIDLYLNTAEENARILLSRPRAIHDGETANNAYLELYRAVRRVNDQLPPDRRIRILALDSEEWPPERALAPNLMARRFGARDRVMLQRVQDVLERQPRVRMLLFVNGLHALTRGGAWLQTGGSRPIESRWLAARLREHYPQDVYSILVDSPLGASARPLVAGYRGTVAGPLLDQEGVGAVGAATRNGFELSRQPITVAAMPGIRFELDPRAFNLADVAQGYIFLGQ